MLSEEYDETPGPGWGGVINWGRLKPYAIDIESSFKFVWAHDIGDDDNHKEWIVRNIFGAGEFSYIVGLPGAGKSMCATDIACHVAAGWDWHGFKVKEPGFVLYVAAERAKLTNRRIRAWRKKHKHAGKLPVLVVSGYMNLTENRNHAIELIELIKIASAKCGLPCHLVVIDTPPARSTEAPAAVEHSDLVLVPCEPDIGAYEQLVRTARLARATGKPAVAVLNMAQPNSRSEENIARQVFETVNLPMVPATLHRLKVHRDASREGLTASEMEPEGKAAAELQALWDWVSAELQLRTNAKVQKGK